MVQVRSTRRGTAYLMVLVGATIVAVIGMSAMASLRAQRAAVTSEADLSQARLLARAAIERGVQIMYEDGAWRTSRGAGTWFTTPVGTRGSTALTVSDPVDGDIANNARDTVQLSAIGTFGQARSLVRMRMTAGSGLGSLESAMHTNAKFKVDASVIRTDQRVSANDDVEGTGGANFYTDVEAADNVSGGTYRAGTLAKTARRQMPDPSTVISTYQSRGVSISYNDLRDGGPNFTSNCSFEDGTTDWAAADGACTLSSQTGAGFARSGVGGVLVSGRTAPTAGVSQDVRTSLVSGRRYRVEAWVKRHNVDVADIRLALRLESQTALAPVVTTWHRTTATAAGAGWTKLEGLFTVSWTGTLLSARLAVETAATLSNYICDDFRIYEDGNNGPRRLREVLLSPQENPYGTGTTQPQGIYVINCGGKDIIIEDCRIVGTLVLIDPGNNSVVQGSVNWSAALSNYPALITDKDLIFRMSAAAVAESAWGVSMNPAGTAYPYPLGTSNNTLNDAFPSRIDGLVYGAKKLFPTRARFRGVVIAHEDIEIRSGAVDAEFSSEFLNNPPPGFDAVQREFAVIEGSFQRWTD